MASQEPEPEHKLFKSSVEASEQPTCEWGNVNSPETYRLLTEARGYFLKPGVIKRRHWIYQERG